MTRNIRVILVRPSISGNIGSAARAVANMNATALILIDPQCEIDEAAKQFAAGAQQWLRQVKVFGSWEHFLNSDSGGYRIALTRRAGKRRSGQPLGEAISDVAGIARATGTGGKSIDLIFGPEADGLNADDLGHAHRLAFLPIPGEFASLNLAQAVLLGLYIAHQSLNVPDEFEQMQQQGSPPATPVRFPDALLKRWLTAMGFSLDKRRMSSYLVLRRLFMRSCPTDYEHYVLESVLQQSTRKHAELNALQMESDTRSALLEEVPDQFS